MKKDKTISNRGALTISDHQDRENHPRSRPEGSSVTDGRAKAPGARASKPPLGPTLRPAANVNTGTLPPEWARPAHGFANVDNNKSVRPKLKAPLPKGTCGS